MGFIAGSARDEPAVILPDLRTGRIAGCQYWRPASSLVAAAMIESGWFPALAGGEPGMDQSVLAAILLF